MRRTQRALWIIVFYSSVCIFFTAAAIIFEEALRNFYGDPVRVIFWQKVLGPLGTPLVHMLLTCVIALVMMHLQTKRLQEKRMTFISPLRGSLFYIVCLFFAGGSFVHEVQRFFNAPLSFYTLFCMLINLFVLMGGILLIVFLTSSQSKFLRWGWARSLVLCVVALLAIAAHSTLPPIP